MNIGHAGLLAVLLGLALIGPSFAAEEIETSLTKAGEGSVPGSEVGFYYKGCEEECHVASLNCDNRNITFTLADVASDQAAKAITSERQNIQLTIAGKPYDFMIQDLRIMEMTGTWWIEGGSSSDPFELLGALEKAKTFEASLLETKATLPVTADVVSWAKDCAK